jgi:hypothetical protein
VVFRSHATWLGRTDLNKASFETVPAATIISLQYRTSLQTRLFHLQTMRSIVIQTRDDML